MFRFLKKYKRLALTLSGAIFFISPSYASSPVFVEFFSNYSCAREDITHEILYDAIKNEQAEAPVFMVNCVQNTDDSQKNIDGIVHDYCIDRRIEYSKRLRSGILLSSAPLVVNGRWMANKTDVITALKFARHDKVGLIEVDQKDYRLDITIPKVEGAENGQIILYAYMPTRDEQRVYVDADVEFNDEIREKIKANQSVPFVTKSRAEPLLTRPVFEMLKIGTWYGDSFSFSYPLKSLLAAAGHSYYDLSYVVVLYKGDDLGPVLAVGEVQSNAEFANLLPKSKPLEIEFASQPMSEMLKR